MVSLIVNIWILFHFGIFFQFPLITGLTIESLNPKHAAQIEEAQ